MKQFALLALAATFSLSVGSADVYDLRVENLVEPLAIDNVEPHFSWKNDASVIQTAYELQVASSRFRLRWGKADVWNTGRVESAEQVMLSYTGNPLTSRQLCWWRVRVWDGNGKASRWSRPQRFGIGVIGDDALKGDYIGCLPGEGRSALLVKEFRFKGRKSTSLLHVNSLGYHEVYINGKKVGDGVLAPAVSQLDKRSLIVTYDVTPYLRRGTNTLVLWTGSGWYKPDTFGAGYKGALVKAELDVVRRGVSTPVLVTDATWKGCWSGYNDLGNWKPWAFVGERIDARTVPARLSRKALKHLTWQPVDVVTVEGIAAVPQMCEPCTVQETFSPVSIEPFGEGSWLIDFGRVVNAQLDITLPCMPAGHVSTASFGDFLKEDGRPDLVSHNAYVSSGAKRGDRFINRFNHHVFRYVLLDSVASAPALSDIRALRMRTAFAEASSFECSDPEMNAIHDMVKYTLENLAFAGYMVDCANIERLGYGGDGNASTLTFQTMFDASPLYMNWLEAWNDVIAPDGSLPHTAPCPYRAGGGPYWCGFIAQAPWRTWMSYGDDRLIHRCYGTMLHWLDYVDAYTTDGLLHAWPDLPNRHWYLGDWATPDGVDQTAPETVDLVNNCSLCQVYAELEQMADHLGKPADAAAFRARYDALAERINAVFYHPEDSTYGTGTQIDMAYPMLVGIVPDSLIGGVRDKLVERTRTVYGGHLATGLVGIPVLTEWTTLAGEADYMYGMLKQHGYPGYLHMLDNGATGTWEHWNARRSRLHNCYNGIGSWFYQALGGIRPAAPGYREVIVAPQCPEGIDWVRVTKETPYGSLHVAWQRTPSGIQLDIDAPSAITVIRE